MRVNRTRLQIAAAATVLIAAIGGVAGSNALASLTPAHADESGSQSPGQPGQAGHHEGDTTLVNDVNAVDRNTVWQQTSKLKLTFPTYHTEGIAFTSDHIFLSSVQIIEPTVKFASPQGGFDRTAGKGIGHLFVMDTAGHLQKDITLGEGDMYHPGGIDFDGTNVWVPVAQYRPNSSAIIYRVDAASLQVHKQFTVNDHFGGIALDKQTGHLVGNTWGSRHFAEWTLDGKQVATWANPNYFIDYQDCQYAANSKMICGGITNLPQTPSAGGSSATYELGGFALLDLVQHTVLRDVPFQQWSTAGHVATRNPFKMTAAGPTLTMHVAPDNGDEGNGTEILTYQATVTSSASAK